MNDTYVVYSKSSNIAYYTVVDHATHVACYCLLTPTVSAD